MRSSEDTRILRRRGLRFLRIGTATASPSDGEPFDIEESEELQKGDLAESPSEI
jgi:hypothetical protein